MFPCPFNARSFNVFPFHRVQIAIGPYEVKEDSFAGLKAAFEAFVYVSDQKFEFTSNRLRTLLPESQVRIIMIETQLMDVIIMNHPNKVGGPGICIIERK